MLLTGCTMSVTPIVAQLVGGGRTRQVGIVLRQGLLVGMAASVLAILLVWQTGVKRLWLIVAGFALAILSTDAIEPARSLYHFSVLAGLALAKLGVLVFLIAWLIRFNLMAYLVAVWSGMLILGPGVAFIQRTTDSVYQWNGIAMVALGLAPLLYLLAAYLRERRRRIAA